MNPQSGRTRDGILFTDQYQLTMAQLYFRKDLHERPAQFDYYFRRYPDYGRHQAGYAVAAGLDPLLEWMAEVRFTDRDLELLRGQRNSRGERRFDEPFLEWLSRNGTFDDVVIKAVPEGRVVHALAPSAIVQGPLGVIQILETSLLNHLNYPTLIATKASRIHEASAGRPSLEFGMRRGPAFGANAGGRAALIGGADFTSNVGVSHELGVDPKGTHAHSMVQVFMALGHGELEAFRAFAEVYPDDCILLVDTINTLKSGVPNAITVFEELRAAGHEPVGIRLDSGDLAYLSIEAAAMLDEAGFEDVDIVLSGNLDELEIWQIRAQILDESTRIDIDPRRIMNRLVYGVGTRLITSQGHEALDGVYKLVAIQDGDDWVPAIKVSDTPEKIPIPGQKKVWRLYDKRGRATADVVGVADEDFTDSEIKLYHPHREGVSRVIQRSDITEVEDLLVEVYRDGARTSPSPSLDTMRNRRTADLDRLDVGVRRLVNPHIYHVSLTEQMKRLQLRLIDEAKGR
ncbi:MAG: nicotinate phosphoribosyltransferase [bacterium]|nr:nicotinate phosphoribosyltransferase [bacterium]MCP4965169.1 nicotinate phosphoribosyltransferase [bacterium]